MTPVIMIAGGKAIAGSLASVPVLTLDADAPAGLGKGPYFIFPQQTPSEENKPLIPPQNPR